MYAFLGKAIIGDMAAIKDVFNSVYGKEEKTNKEFESELVVTISGPMPPDEK